MHGWPWSKDATIGSCTKSDCQWKNSPKQWGSKCPSSGCWFQSIHSEAFCFIRNQPLHLMNTSNKHLKLRELTSNIPGLEKTWIPACSWGKHFSHFACPGPLLAVLVNDFVRGWLAWILPCPLGKLLARKENLVVPDHWMGIFSSPANSILFMYFPTANNFNPFLQTQQ